MSDVFRKITVKSSSGDNGSGLSDADLGALITWTLALDHSPTDEECEAFLASIRKSDA